MRLSSALRLLLAALGTLSLFARSASAQPSWRDHLDITRARSAVDSFDVRAGDRTIGWQRLGWQRTTITADTPAGSVWQLSDEVALTGVQQRSVVHLSERFVEVALRQQGEMGPRPMRIHLDRRGDRLHGSALTPRGGADPVPLDVAAGDAVIDDNALTPLLPLLAWRDGLSIALPVLSSGTGAIESFTATVEGPAVTTVPAGTFDTWRIAVAGGRYVLEAHVTRAAPYRLVQFGPRGAPMVSQLVR
jgi:hypothetical protein